MSTTGNYRREAMAQVLSMPSLHRFSTGSNTEDDQAPEAPAQRRSSVLRNQAFDNDEEGITRSAGARLGLPPAASEKLKQKRQQQPYGTRRSSESLLMGDESSRCRPTTSSMDISRCSTISTVREEGRAADTSRQSQSGIASMDTSRPASVDYIPSTPQRRHSGDHQQQQEVDGYDYTRRLLTHHYIENDGSSSRMTDTTSTSGRRHKQRGSGRRQHHHDHVVDRCYQADAAPALPPTQMARVVSSEQEKRSALLRHPQKKYQSHRAAEPSTGGRPVWQPGSGHGYHPESSSNNNNRHQAPSSAPRYFPQSRQYSEELPPVPPSQYYPGTREDYSAYPNDHHSSDYYNYHESSRRPPRESYNHRYEEELPPLERYPPRTVTTTGRVLPRGNDYDFFSVGKPVMVEIEPGTPPVPLRSADETLQAVARKHYRPVTCLACDLELFCIDDCAYFLCPECRVTTSAKTHSFYNNNNNGTSRRTTEPPPPPLRRYGLGLGFTRASLSQMHQQLQQEREQQDSRYYHDGR